MALADAAHTLRIGRAQRQHRAVVVAADAREAAAALRDRKRCVTGTADQPPQVAFLFSGQGSQYGGMGAQLYRHEPVFAAAVDECLAVLGADFRQLLFDPAAAEQLGRPAHPALFTSVRPGPAVAELGGAAGGDARTLDRGTWPPPWPVFQVSDAVRLSGPSGS